MKSIDNLTEARKFLNMLGGRSPADLSEESRITLVENYHPTIKVKGNPRCPVEEAPKKNVYMVAKRLYEKANEFLRKSRQIVYHTLSELETVIKQDDKEKVERLEERICIQLESNDIRDEKSEAHYKSLQKLKEKQELQEVPF